MVRGVKVRLADSAPGLSGSGSRSCVAAACLLTALLSGCVTTTTGGPLPQQQQQQPGSSAQQPVAGRDIVTASDETERQKRARIRLELATGYFTQGNLRTALDEVKQAIAIDATSRDAYNLRGLIYDALGDESLAQDSFERALQLDPGDAGVMQNLGWFHCKRKRYEQADPWLRRAAEAPQNPARSQSLLVRGICQARAGQPEQAEATLLRAYEFDPANPAIGTNIAALMLRRGDAQRASFYIRRVNEQEATANAESLWLGLRIERRLGNGGAEAALAERLRSRFPKSRETLALDQGRYEE